MNTLKQLVKRGRKLAGKKADNTKRAYKSDMRIFRKWCKERGLCALPATEETIIAFIVDRSDQEIAVSTIARSLCAISQAHKRTSKTANAALSSAVAQTMAGLRKDRGASPKQARPLVTQQLARILSKFGPSISEKRDAAILAIGWACALRSAEIVALNFGDIELEPEGMIITIRRSKTDQEAKGRKIGIPFAADDAEFCPVCKVQSWLSLSSSPNQPSTDPVFYRIQKGADRDFFNFKKEKKRLSTQSISAIVRQALELANYNPFGYSSHSLRAGLITSAAGAGVPEWAIMKHTRHTSEKVMRSYIRDGTLFRDNPITALLGRHDPPALPAPPALAL